MDDLYGTLKQSGAAEEVGCGMLRWLWVFGFDLRFEETGEYTCTSFMM